MEQVLLQLRSRRPRKERQQGASEIFLPSQEAVFRDRCVCDVVATHQRVFERFRGQLESETDQLHLRTE